MIVNYKTHNCLDAEKIFIMTHIKGMELFKAPNYEYIKSLIKHIRILLLPFNLNLKLFYVTHFSQGYMMFL